jgi:predicted phosphodiesterase
MRLAILSDIHGNPIALDAVLADIQAQGVVDACWVLGDLAAIGYDPVTPLQKLVTLPNVRFVRGNTDRYVVTGDLPIPQEKVRQDPALIPALVEFAQSFAWTRGYVTAAGWLDWLANLPLEQRLTLPDGTRLLGVHAAPGRDDGPGIHPQQSDAELQTLLAGCEADLVIVGHTHVPMDRMVGGVRVVNLGSVSNPITADLRATYVLLDADRSGCSIELRRVDYDREAVIRAVHQVRHPTPTFLIQHMRGERRVRPVQPG